VKRMRTGIIAVLFFAAVLCGCVETHFGISDGTYAVDGKRGAPQIRFDIGSDQRTFCYIAGNALPIEGTFEIKNGYVKGLSESDQTEVVFEIKDNHTNHTICFRQKKSSVLCMEDGVTPITDGTEFILTGEE